MRHTSLTLALARLVASSSQQTSNVDSDGFSVADPQGVTWEVAYERAEAALARLSTQEKVDMVTGVGFKNGPCVGNTKPVSKIKYPSLCLQDGPVGVRYAKGVTVFPAGVHAASTWDLDLMYKRGFALGQEAKDLGVHVQLGPVAGPLGKIPHGGRNWEGFSPDPYLTGYGMIETIKGMQEAGVQANAKHYIGNEQEVDRTKMTSDIDDRTMHELYLWPFADAVWANVASVMCSYNKLNGTWACENDKVMNGLLKGELNFKGYIMSDWDAQHTIVESANTGLDMAMPGDDFKGFYLWGEKLTKEIGKKVKVSRLDDMIRRILASWYYLGQDQGYPTVTMNSWKGGAGGKDVQRTHKTVARAVARDGIVLLKNDQGLLPLQRPKSIAIIGQGAFPDPKGPNSCEDRGCNRGHMAMGYGSGTADYPYLITPYDALKERAQKEGTTLVKSDSDDAKSGAAAASKADLAMVFITADSGEQYVKVENLPEGDRLDLNPWHNGNELVAAVAAAGKPTVVVVHSVGPILLEKILSNENVKAIVWAGLPGQESGGALTDVLYGDVSPNGKLPYTIAKREEDYGVQITRSRKDDFKERIYIDYRHFDKSNIEPRYEFGFGLSYTSFSYANLSVSGAPAAAVRSAATADQTQAELYQSTGHSIEVTITNTGKVAGKEIAQLYLSFPSIEGIDFPPQQLRGFRKVSLEPGESKSVQFALRKKDISYWSVATQKWEPVVGKVGVKVAGSSRIEGATGELIM